jgi:4-diphosphocytidyl-2-C-methyl-D-erythritol kinase
MRQITVAAPAKINLSLDVTGRRSDGYHLLSTIMQSIDLADRVTVKIDPASASGRHIGLSCSRGGLPLDGRNTAYRAAALYLEIASLNLDLQIYIEKTIPASAGLAGGSADAAAVLYALDCLFPGQLDRPALFAAAARIGADVPFCLQGGTALCEGIGEILTPLPPLAGIPVLLAKPGFGLSTPWVFSRLNMQDLDQTGCRPAQDRVLAAVTAKDLPALAGATGNALESVSLPAYPVLRQLKSRLLEAGAAFALMSGSGPTVYGLFADAGRRDAALAAIGADPRQENLLLVPANTVATGPRAV